MADAFEDIKNTPTNKPGPWHKLKGFSTVRGVILAQLLLKGTSTGFEPASSTCKPSVLPKYTNWSLALELGHQL